MKDGLRRVRRWIKRGLRRNEGGISLSQRSILTRPDPSSAPMLPGPPDSVATVANLLARARNEVNRNAAGTREAGERALVILLRLPAGEVETEVFWDLVAETLVLLAEEALAADGPKAGARVLRLASAVCGWGPRDALVVGQLETVRGLALWPDPEGVEAFARGSASFLQAGARQAAGESHLLRAQLLAELGRSAEATRAFAQGRQLLGKAIDTVAQRAMNRQARLRIEGQSTQRRTQ